MVFRLPENGKQQLLYKQYYNMELVNNTRKVIYILALKKQW